jgi:hypothetical protein
VLALIVACGETSGGSPDATADAGETGLPNAGAPGEPGEPGGAPAIGSGGRGEAGEAGEASSEAGAGGAREATGGTASGGVSTGGSAAGGVSVVPDGCEAISPILAEQHCSLGLTCDDRRLSVACTNDRGLWTCSCSGAETSVIYEIPDLASAQTCELAAKACAEPGLLTGEETCRRSGSNDEFACSLRDECETWHEIDGRRLRTRRDWQATCKTCPTSIDAGGLGLSCCRCSDEEPVPGRELADYRLADYDPTSGCDFLAELCQAESFEPAGDLECQTLQLSTSLDFGCQVVTRCYQPIELEGGGELTLGGEYYSSCTYVSDDSTSCRCGDADNQLSYEIAWELPYDEIATCRAVDAACTGVAPPEFDGEPECTPYFDTLTSDSCVVRRECDQPALVGGNQATVRTQASARCQREDPGSETWVCNCTSTNAASFELEGGDAESTCGEAVAQCAELTPGI